MEATIGNAPGTTLNPIYNPAEDPELISVTIKYPKDYSGKKFLSEGIHYVSKESAATFISKGITEGVSGKISEEVKKPMTDPNTAMTSKK